MTILDRVHNMLKHSGFAKLFWAEATSTAVYLINRSGVGDPLHIII